MAENLFYYFVAFNLAAVLFLVCAIIAAEHRSRRERQKRARIRAACSEIIRLRDQKMIPQPGPTEEQEPDIPPECYEDVLEAAKKLQRELNRQVLELEKER